MASKARSALRRAQGRFDDAIAAAEAVIMENPGEPWARLARFISRSANTNSPRMLLAKRLELETKLLPAAFGLGWVYSFLGRNVEAAKVFEGLIEGGVQSLDAVFALANLPAAVVSIDLLRELDKAVRDEAEDAAEFENTAAFVRAAALDGLSRHVEAWELLVRAVNGTARSHKPNALQRQAQRIRRRGPMAANKP
jgi:tetratricopeptide (TPR) repeat protein